MQPIQNKKINEGISPAKANRLYWLGRYAERVYLTLHILRMHYDQMLDEDNLAYNNFCTKMGIKNCYTSISHFMDSYLYDPTNPDSITNMLERVHDNAIMLREEIMSDSLSYVQMSINFLKESQKAGKIFSELQTISDFMLAFWGSVDERMH